MKSNNKTPQECAEEKGYKVGYAGLPYKNPYSKSKYGFGAAFRNAWTRGYENGSFDLQTVEVK